MKIIKRETHYSSKKIHIFFLITACVLCCTKLSNAMDNKTSESRPELKNNAVALIPKIFDREGLRDLLPRLQKHQNKEICKINPDTPDQELSKLEDIAELIHYIKNIK